MIQQKLRSQAPSRGVRLDIQSDVLTLLLFKTADCERGTTTVSVSNRCPFYVKQEHWQIRCQCRMNENVPVTRTITWNLDTNTALLRGSYEQLKKQNRDCFVPCTRRTKTWPSPGSQNYCSPQFTARPQLLAYSKHHFDRQAVLMTILIRMRHKATCVELLLIPTASRRSRKTRPNFVLTDFGRA